MEPEDQIEPEPTQEPPLTPRRRRKQITTLMIVALLGAVAAGLLLASTVWQWKWEKSPPSTPPQSMAAADPAKACTLQSAFDAIKAELFRRAAALRGRDQDAYTRIADFSLLRVDSPSVAGVDQQQQRVDCSGTATLELPPQITIASGGSMLTSPITYSVQLGPGGSGNVIAIGNADAIIDPLATIVSVAPPTPLVAPGFSNEMGPPPDSQAQPSPGPIGNQLEAPLPPAPAGPPGNEPPPPPENET